MKRLNRFGRGLAACSLLGAMAVGAATLATPRAEARPILLCGPTYQWICTLPGGEVVPFGGTICEMLEFEKRKHADCVVAPAPFPQF